MTTRHTLYEGVLNDDYLTKCDDGSVLITYYTPANEWCDYVYEKACYDMDKAMSWYMDKFRNRVFKQGKRWIEEDKEYSYIADTPEAYWTYVVTTQGMEI